MKKKGLVLLLVSIFTFSNLIGDEGMWLLPLIEKLNMKELSQKGFKLSAKDIYNLNGNSLKDAIVHFGGGCTGEIISADGLVLTNHHCGYSHIQKLSSVENDFLQTGFWAMERGEELPAEGLSVTFMESFTDVTKIVEKRLRKAKDGEQKSEAMAALTKELTEKGVAGRAGYSANLSSMYGGNSYYLIVSKTYSDVRFVGAPPSSIGKFGADSDNWVWPRHTGDFALFRVYADENNDPASYSPNNRPYKASKHLPISIKGVEQGDFAMIIGYPGRTSRYITSAEVIENRDITNAAIIEARGVRQEILMADMESDPKIRLQYSNKYSSSSNFWKKATGMNETFAKLKVVERRAAEERAFAEWVSQKKSRIKEYGDALEQINGALERRAEPQYLFRWLQETLFNIELSTVANHYNGVAKLYAAGDKERGERAVKMLQSRIENFYKNYSVETDRKVAKAMIKLYKERVKEESRPSFYKTIDEKFGGDIDQFVDHMFDNSPFVSLEALTEALEKRGETLIDDLALEVGVSTFSLMPNLMDQVRVANQGYGKAHKSYIAGQLEMKKGREAIYPDANSTMRMTYGSVLDYSPRDAVRYNHLSTLTGVMEKEDPNNWEFVVPERLKELYKNRDYGRYATSTGEMAVGFISNNDITGGNSGSPVINGDGELIGVAFDGNWEAMSGDIIFEPVLQRCINVDIRYVLFIIDKFGGAGHLIEEMTIVE